ncbi:MAG TPA: adenylate cyclase, partial [Pseudomonas sp.]|nr:adenylate cyclase [Pseudomonas sp.]
GSLVPSLMFMLTLSFSALVVGSLRHLLMTLLMVCIGAGLTSLLVPLRFEGVSSVLVSTVSILLTTLYVCVTAYYVHQQGIRLAQARSEVEAQQAKAARLARSLAKYLSPQVWESIFSGKRT